MTTRYHIHCFGQKPTIELTVLTQYRLPYVLGMRDHEDIQYTPPPPAPPFTHSPVVDGVYDEL